MNGQLHAHNAGGGQDGLTTPTLARHTRRDPDRVGCTIQRAENAETDHGDSTPILTQELHGLRLEPIVALADGNVVAHEVLMSVSNPEHFFKTLGPELALSIMVWQTETFSQKQGRYTINVPVKVLADTLCFRKLCKVNCASNLKIEIQDPASLLNLSPWDLSVIISNVHQLVGLGWNFILDDMTRGIVNILPLKKMRLAAVKIDRSESRNIENIDYIITRIRSKSTSVVVEGIETPEDLARVKLTGAMYGQGYLWPETKIDCLIPGELDARARAWKDERIKQIHTGVALYIDGRNNYFVNGMHYLLLSIIEDMDNEGISFRVIDNINDADIVIKERHHTELPEKCHQFDRIKGVAKENTIYAVDYSEAGYRRKGSIYPCVKNTFAMTDSLKDIARIIKMAIKSKHESRTKRISRKRVQNQCNGCGCATLNPGERNVMQEIYRHKSMTQMSNTFSCSVKVVSQNKLNAMRKLNQQNLPDFLRFASRVRDLE